MGGGQDSLSLGGNRDQKPRGGEGGAGLERKRKKSWKGVPYFPSLLGREEKKLPTQEQRKREFAISRFEVQTNRAAV